MIRNLYARETSIVRRYASAHLAGVLLAALLAAGTGRAETSDEIAAIDRAFERCIAKDNSDPGMKTCAGDAESAADALLNKTYAGWLNRLKRGTGEDATETLKRLVASERAWIAFRDADCRLEGTSMLGGTGEGLIETECRYTRTKDRARALAALANAP